MPSSGASSASGLSTSNYGTLSSFNAAWGAELESLQKNWGWLLALGIALLALGCVAISLSLLTTLATVIVIGVALVMGGTVQLISAFWARGWRGFFVGFLAGIIYLVLGFLMTSHPLGAAAGLTLMLAALFLATGLTRIVLSLLERFPGRGWVLLNGAVSFFLGLMIWRQWPADAFWVIGLFVGIDLVFSGWSWIMLAMGLRMSRKVAS